MLEIKNASKTFAKGTQNEHVALQHLNLALQDGDFVTIVGSNGAGKSTLFNAICGNFLLDKGSIILDGIDLTYMKEHKRASYIGRLFQDPMRGTAPNMTIEENLALCYSRSKRKVHGDRERRPVGFALNRRNHELFQNALAEFHMGLEDRMETKMGLLSGGQRQVVTLLMGTLVPPKLLLLDEHTAALDPATAEKIMEITNEIVDRHHLTTLMITHNLKSALETGNRTIMMDSGDIILDISGEEKANMSMDDMLKRYAMKKKQEFDNDRVLLS